MTDSSHLHVSNIVMIYFMNRNELLVDDDDQGQEQSASAISDTGGLLRLGNSEFQGCMSNLYTRR